MSSFACTEHERIFMESFSLILSEQQFERIRNLVHRVSGINLQNGKEGLVKARLLKRLRMLGISNFETYMRYLDRDKSGKEISAMIDALTTNKTNFFRERQHFDFFYKNIIPYIKEGKKKFWSAGCSSGEEAFSLAMLLHEGIPEIEKKDIRILATDISMRMLQKGRDGFYEKHRLDGVPKHFLQKYFNRIKTEYPTIYQVKKNLRKSVRFAWLNLINPWPMQGPFHIIFCRNVMIYFNKETQQKLIQRFWELLEPGGYLFVGHSESLASSANNFRYVRPAIYIK